MADHVVHCSDCLDPVTGLASLADGSVDVVLTDPPYSEHVHSCSMRGTAGWKGGISEERDLGFEPLDGRSLLTASHHFARVARRWVAVFSDTESAHLWRDALVARGLEYVRTCFWHKVLGAPQFTGDRPAVACEAITLCHRPGKKRWNGGGRQGLYQVAIAVGRPGRQQDDARVHTTQKPIALMEALVRDFTDEGETVLDPFAGSGTTGVACRRLGRRFIGFERDPKYAAIAEKRIAGAREQLRMFEGVA
jgi:DNA modification methylase